MRQVLIYGMIVLLTGCGGGNNSRARQAPPLRDVPISSGPISQACLTSDRKARSRALCGCIQAVADQTLSGSQQRRAVAFYSDPHLAQQLRQSDNSNDERFWEAYAAYAGRAQSTCS